MTTTASTSYKEEWLTGPQSTQFYTRTYLPPGEASPKAVIVFVHGFAEHIGRYTHFHPWLAQRGIAVFAFDQRGYGLTAQDTTGRKSKTSAYGKTCWKDQMGDIDWALKHARNLFPGIPIFLMGHSMGGAEALGFPIETSSSYKDGLALVTAVISTSPLIAQTSPAPSLMKWLGSMASVLLPNTLIPADVNADDLCHDSEVNAAYLKDPLVKQQGSLKGISDMLSKGEALRKELYKNWPPALPVLIVHGNEDKVTCCKASKEFYEAIPATNKKFELFEGGFHELQNEPDGVKEKLVEQIVNFVEETVPTAQVSGGGGSDASVPKASL